MVESIAEKEIQKDPIDFIRRESFQVGNEDNYSVDSDLILEPPVEQIKELPAAAEEDEDDDGNEYHEEEKAVANRIGIYRETTESINDILLSQQDQKISSRTDLKHEAVTVKGPFERNLEDAKKQLLKAQPSP